jgi:CDP-glucose 4,6-dehydratase
LVTGGTGFVGGHLVEALIKEKANVYVIDINFDKRLYLFTENLHKKSEVINLNICNYKKLSALVKKHKIEFIFHLAAQSLVEPAYKDPKATLDNNILSTVNVLEIVRINPKIKGVIVASSDKAYGDLHKSKYKETDPLAGDHPYETSKSATDLISTTYYKTYRTPVIITRFGNIYGEGDLNFSRIVPGIMEAIAKNKRLDIRSNGKLIRDYLYVKDVVNGYILLAKNIDKLKGEAFNFGSKETLSVIEVIRTVEKALNKKTDYKILNVARNEIPYQSLNYSKIKKTLKWQPRYSIKKTALTMLNWYKSIIK